MRVIVVDASVGGDRDYCDEAIAETSLTEQTEVKVVAAEGAGNFGEAIGHGLTQAPEITTPWMWLLHDDSPPEPEAHAELLKATGTSRAVGIAGCKQLDFDDPTRLLSVGVRYTRAGRRLSEIEPGEVDQGQYDDREDIYAVGTAGMLIRTRTWNDIGGMNPALGPFLDGAELSRRVRLAGERVLVVPTAKVRHARGALWHGPGRTEPSRDGAHSFLARRVAALHFRLVTINAWGVALAALVMLGAAPIRALWRVAGGDLTLAGHELRAPLATLGRPGRIFRSRRLVSSTATARRTVLRPLYATRREVRALWWHRWRAHRVERRRAIAPSELEITERRTITARRRGMVSLLMLALVALGGLLIPHAFAGSAFTFPTLTGGGLGGVDESYLDLWKRAVSAWNPGGDGAPAPAAPFTAVLALLATVVGGPLGVSSHAPINLLLTLGFALAGLSAWFAAGALTRSVLLRAWAALAWALLPVLALGVNHGRVAAVVAHILIPLAGLALMRTFGLDQRDVIRSGMAQANENGSGRSRLLPALSRESGSGTLGAAAAAGLVIAGVSAAAPILLPALGTLLIAIGIAARRRRARLLLVALPTLVLFAPLAVYAGQHGWSHLLRSPGRSVPINLAHSAESGPQWLSAAPWHVLSGWGQWPAPTVVAAACAGVLASIALVGLFRRGRPGRAARWGWLIAGVGVLTAIGADHLHGEPQYDWLGSFQRLPEWIGPGASLAGAGMIVAALSAVMGVHKHLSERSLGWRHGALTLAAAGMVGVMAAGGVNSAVTVLSEPEWHARAADPLPALARETLAGEERSRVLMLAPTGEAMTAALWRSNGPQLLGGGTTQTILPSGDEAHDDLAELVAALSAGNVQEAGSRLGEHAIAFILLPTPEATYAVIDGLARAELAAALDGVGDLERVTEGEAGILWRVSGPTARVQVHAGEHHLPVDSQRVSVNTELPEIPAEGQVTLTLAERADPRWRATAGGHSLRALETGWHQAFDIPAGAQGTLTIEYVPTLHRLWTGALIGVFGFSAVLALPVRRRPEVVQ